MNKRIVATEMRLFVFIILIFGVVAFVPNVVIGLMIAATLWMFWEVAGVIVEYIEKINAKNEHDNRLPRIGRVRQ